MRKGLDFILILITININNFDCAKESGKLGRIVRGQDAVIGQFPYAVRLLVDKIKIGCFGCITITETLACGGALISPTWILTAAHCVADGQSVEVYLGSISKDSAKVVYGLPISEVIVPPLYRSRSMQNDIALIRIPYTKLCWEIGIVPLPKLSPSKLKYERANVTACGWGLRSGPRDLPEILQWGRLQILPSAKCKYLDIVETQICTTISPKFATVNCGDSGGPLVLETTGELVGIGSITHGGICENRHPAFFTRVTSYLEWIKSVSGISY